MATVFEVRDELWEVAEPLIPPVSMPAKQGRRPVPDRVCFNAIVFVLVTGIAWAHLPRELGCSGTTAWRRLRDWQAAGVWERLHQTLLDRLNAVGAIDGSASVVRRQPYPRSSRGPKPGPLRLTVAGWAPSTTCWSTRPASHSRLA